MSSVIPTSPNFNNSQPCSSNTLQLEDQFDEDANETFCFRPLDNPNSDFFILDDTKNNAFKLGKSKKNADFVIEDDGLANVHAILTLVCDSWVISREKTLESSCFIQINGKAIKKSRVLDEGDEICLGSNVGNHYRFSFEKYLGQDERKYDPDCPNFKCHSRLHREFLCEDCMERENEIYKITSVSTKTETSRYCLIPLDDTTNNGEPIKVPGSSRYTYIFRSKTEWKYQMTVMFTRGNKGFYARCDNYKLNPRSFCVSSQYPEDLFALLKEGDRIEISFLPEDQDDGQSYEFGVVLPAVCPDCQGNGSCDNCKQNKIGKFTPQVDDQEMEDPRYLVSISDENNRDFIRLLGTRMVIGNVTRDDLDHVLEFDSSREVLVEFLRGRGGLWFANASKDGTINCFYINGNESSPFQLLKDGDVVQFGASTNGPVYLFRYTAISKLWSFRLDSRVNIASSNVQTPKTTITRYDRQNCLEEIRFVKSFVENCKEKINLKYNESKLFKRCFIVDNHEIKDVHDEMRLGNVKNECFLDWNEINNSNCRDFSQNVDLLEDQNCNYVLDARISNAECHNYHQNINLSSNANKSKTIYLAIISVKCNAYCHQVKLAPSGDEKFQTNVRIRNFNCRNFRGEILVKSENVRHFVRDIYIQNNWCDDIQQEVVLVNKDAVNGFLRIWLVNVYSRNCSVKIVVDNINAKNLHLDILLENKGSEKYLVDVRVNNENCERLTYKIKHFHSVVETESYEPDQVRLTVSDLKSSETALVSYVKVTNTLDHILKYCFRIGFNLGWYLTRLPTCRDDAPKSETYNLQIRRLLPFAVSGSKPDDSELMEYIRENHPNITIQNYGAVYGCMLASGPVNVHVRDNYEE